LNIDGFPFPRLSRSRENPGSQARLLYSATHNKMQESCATHKRLEKLP
jgi:hypothetical protein